MNSSTDKDFSYSANKLITYREGYLRKNDVLLLLLSLLEEVVLKQLRIHPDWTLL
jgi:hypothetical protein